MFRLRALALSALVVSGCIEPNAFTCADGTLCPTGYECAPGYSVCAPTAEVEACKGRDAGTACSLSETSAGVCVRGVCTATTTVTVASCGDGIVEPSEDCEPGMPLDVSCTAAGFYNGTITACTDACKYDRTACSGTCGDLAVDVTHGEQCDGQASVTQSCVDYGFDSGPLTCSASCGIDTTKCRYFGWRSEPNSNEETLNAVWAADADHAFAVGGSGTILSRINGVWTKQDSHTNATLRAVWGVSAQSVFAVGDVSSDSPDAGVLDDGVATSFTIRYFDGTQWTPMIGPDITSSGGIVPVALNAVWGTSYTNVFAVGSDFRGTSSVVLHFDGTAWAVLPGSGADYSTSYLTSVTAVGVDLFFVEQAFAAPNDLGVDSGQRCLIHHYDGAVWTTDNVPGPIVGLWAATADDVYAVSSTGTIYRFDGTQWKSSPSVPTLGTANVTAYPTTALWGVHEASKDELFATGEDGRTYYSDGTSSWTAMDTGSSSPLAGISGADASSVYAVGEHGTILHFGGAASIDSVPLSGAMRGVWAPSDLEAFAVGDGGVIEHYAGARWSVMSSGIEVTLYGVWGAAPDDLFAVGAGGAQLHFDGSTWSSIAGLEDILPAWRAVWGRSSTEVYAAGDDGRIQRWDGSSWTSETSGISATLYAVGGDGNNVFAAGAAGAFVQRSGAGAWSSASFAGPAPTFTIRALDGATYGAAVGDFPYEILLRQPAETWLPVSAESSVALRTDANLSSSAVVLPDDNVFNFVGSAGGGLYETFDTGSFLIHTVSQTTSALNGLKAVSLDHIFAATGDGSCDYRVSTNAWACSSRVPTVAADAAGNRLAMKGAAALFTSGPTWRQTAPAPASVHALWARGDGTFIGVGDQGAAASFDGMAWTPLSTPGPTVNALLAVYGASPTQVYAVGEGGSFLAGDGSSFHSIPSNTSVTLAGVWAANSSTANVFAVGQHGTVVHYDGSTVTSSTQSSSDLNAVWGSSPTDIYAAAREERCSTTTAPRGRS